jgi:uncharacterized protein (DUF58 family)
MTTRTAMQTRPSVDPVKVTLADLVRLAPLARELELWQTARQVEDGGNRLSLFKGRGMEFAETRPYQPGDDVRQIDWRVTARTGRPHTKLYREERERPVMTWVDLRAHMFFATRGMFKSAMAVRLTALVAWAAHAHGDRIGGCVTGTAGESILEPDRGRHGVLRFLRALEQGCAYDPCKRTSILSAVDVSRSLLSLRRTVRPGTIVFLVSDFHDLLVETADLLASLGPHCDLTLCCIHDPLEAELPPPGWYPIAAADGQRLLIETTDPMARRQHAEHFQSRLQELDTLARSHRARFVSMATTDDPLRVLRSVCNPRGRTASR